MKKEYKFKLLRLCPKCQDPIGMKFVTDFSKPLWILPQYWECTRCWYRIDMTVKGEKEKDV